MLLKKDGILLRYINKVKFRHGLGIPKTCGYQYCGEKTGFDFRAMLAQYYFALPVLHNILYGGGVIGHFTILPVCL